MPMEFSEGWKSLWPSSNFSAPLKIPGKESKIPFGPLIFTPTPNSSKTLLSSPSIAPCLPPPYPELSLPRFLQNSHSVPFSATSITSLLGSQLPNPSSHFHGFNSLQLLQIPNKNLVVLIFPVGENADRVGASLLSVQDGNLNSHSQRENFFHTTKEGNKNHHRITHLLVNPVDDCFDYGNEDIVVDDSSGGKKRCNMVTTVGFLMACTKYSVDWYRIGVSKDGQNEYFVCLDYLGCADAKMLRGNIVASASWSPHSRNECLVLLENGDLLLFDADDTSKRKNKSMFFVNNIVRKRMKVSLNEKVGLGEEHAGGGLPWFGCGFSWHSRLFVACHCKELFLVDSMSAGECRVSSLLKIDEQFTLKNDEFLTLARADEDGYVFAVSTMSLLLLCDVRKPSKPVIWWTHGIRNPRYISVFGLSKLRANANDASYKLASEYGYCIMLGSFWDNEVCLFCYGPNLNQNASVHAEISKFCNSTYAWGDCSEFSLSGSDCNCGNCIVSRKFSKESLLVWIDWRQKQHLVLGFGILHPDLYAQLTPSASFGGFMLIRLTSSGKLEAQHYSATWEPETISVIGHKRKAVYLEDNLLYDRTPSGYDGIKKFQHLKLEYLNASLKDKLAKLIVRKRGKREGTHQRDQLKQPINAESKFHEEICDRLNYFELPRVRSSVAISDVMKEISLPTSIHDIALRSMYAMLPTNLLQLAFSTYANFGDDSEYFQEPLEFLGIPDQLQLPPCSFRSPSNRCNKWSSKTRPPDDALVGPIIPPQFLVTLHKIYMEELKSGTEPYLKESEDFSALSHFKLQCKKVEEVVQQHVSQSDAKDDDEDCASLKDDKDDVNYPTQKLKLSYHKASAFLGHPSSVGSMEDNHDELSTHVFRRSTGLTFDISADMVGKELYDVGCPIELKFDDCSIDFSPRELESYKNLKKQDLNFLKNFKPYQDYINEECKRNN